MPAENHPVFKHPENQHAAIWRYMDFTKFVAMLESSSLFFARADCLGDPFEGSYSRGNEKLRPIVYKDTPDHVLDIIKTQGSEFSKRLRQWTFVNCWHMNESESAGMWKLYAKTNEAIAIKSNFTKLFDELDSGTYVGLVEYIDFDHDWIPEGNVFFPYVHKRRSFAHEQEIRALFTQFPSEDGKLNFNKKPPEGGLEKKVNVNNLIESVYVAPTCPGWFKSLVEKVCAKYGVNKQVIQSSLDAEPFF